MRIRSSTLLETMISMAMTAGILATSMVIYANVLHSDRSLQRTQARLLIDHTFERALGGGIDGTDGEGALQVSVEQVPLPLDLQRVTVKVTNAEGDIVLERVRILQGPWDD